MTDSGSFDASDAVKSTYAHYIIFGCSAFSMAWGAWNTILVS